MYNNSVMKILSLHWYLKFSGKSMKNLHSIGVGGMGVLLSITMAKSFFGGKYLVNTEYRHKKTLFFNFDS